MASVQWHHVRVLVSMGDPPPKWRVHKFDPNPTADGLKILRPYDPVNCTCHSCHALSKSAESLIHNAHGIHILCLNVFLCKSARTCSIRNHGFASSVKPGGAETIGTCAHTPPSGSCAGVRTSDVYPWPASPKPILLVALFGIGHTASMGVYSFLGDPQNDVFPFGFPLKRQRGSLNQELVYT